MEKENLEIKKELEYNFPPVTAALLGLVGVFLLYQIGGSLLTLIIFGLDIQNADMNGIRLLTMGSQIMFILLPALILTKIVYNDVSAVLRVKMPQIKEVGIFSLGLIILTPVLQNYLYIQNYVFTKLAEISPFVNKMKSVLDQLDKYVEKTYENILNATNPFEAVLIVLVVAAIPALCEEVFFRGFVQKSFELKSNKFIGALITAIIFGLYHFNPYGLIALIALGLYLGYATYKSGSIIVAFVVHFLNNFIAIMAYLLFGKEDLITTDQISASNLYINIISLISMLIVFGLFVFYVNRFYKRKLTNNGGENDMS